MKFKTLKENGRKRYYWDYVDPATSKRKRLSSYDKNKLEKMVADRVKEIGFGEQGAKPFSAYINNWLETVRSVTIRPSTLERYRLCVSKIEADDVGNFKMRDLNDQKIQFFYNHTFKDTGSADAVKQIDKIVRPCIKYAAARHDIDFDFMPLVYVPRDTAEKRREKRQKRQEKKLSLEEQAKLTEYLVSHIGHPRETHCMLFLVQLYTGMRVGEALALTWTDVETNSSGTFFIINKIFQRVKIKNDDGTISSIDRIGEPKSDQGYRRIVLPQEFVPLLEKHRLCQKEQLAKLQIAQTKDTPIFATLSGAHKDYHNVNKSLKRICKKIGIREHSTHDLRHTFSTRCMESGIPEVVTQKWMGDSSVQVIRDTYQTMRDEVQRINMQKVTNYLNFDFSPKN